MKKILAVTVLFTFLAPSILFAESNKRIFIQRIEGKSINATLLNQIRNIITVTITETYGNDFYIINDDDIKIMYKQAEKLLTSGDNEENLIENIAKSINSDIIIYGTVEFLSENQYALILHKLEKVNNGYNKSNMLRQNFSFEAVNFTIPEFAKKIVDNSYEIKYSHKQFNNERSITDTKDLKIISNDQFILDLAQLVNNRVKEIDSTYNTQDPSSALDEYSLLLEDINTKLTSNNKNEIKPIINLVKERIDSCNLQLINLYDANGDTEYYGMNFFSSFKLYKKSFAAAAKIFNKKQKTSLLKLLTVKINRTIKTGENFLYNSVKSKLDQSQYKNLLNDMTFTDEVNDANELILSSIFRSVNVIKLYNEYIELLLKNDIEVTTIILESNKYIVNNDQLIDLTNQYNSYNTEDESENPISIIETLDLENDRKAYILEYFSDSETPDNYAIFFNGIIFPNKTKLNLKTESHIVFKNYLIFNTGEDDNKNYLFLNLQGKVISSFNNVCEAGYCSFNDEKLFAFYTIKKIGEKIIKIDYYNFNFNKAKSFNINTDEYNYISKSKSIQPKSMFSFYIDTEKITHIEFGSE
jgi:hypothetical protein